MLSQNAFKIITDEMMGMLRTIQKQYKIKDNEFLESYDKQFKDYP